MARKFLYVMAVLIALFIAGRIAIGFWYQDLATVALVPSEEWRQPAPVKNDAYADPAMWISRPGLGSKDPAQWYPDGFKPDGPTLPVAVFFVHPTSYLNRAGWNAPLDDPASRQLAERIVRGIASPFNRAAELWAPRYRQATFGAFLAKGPEGQAALDLAYGDVDAAFATFIARADPKLPIVLAGHSQGSFLLRRLIKERVAGTPLAARVIAAYPVGWPVSVEHDLPGMAMPACAAPDQTGCVVSWLSFAEPAETAQMLRDGARIRGLDGQPVAGGTVVCSNPLTGGLGGIAPASAGLGTLVPDPMLIGGKLVPQLTGASCMADGSLSIGNPVEMGPYTLPGNNYHVYDIPLFWANLRADFAGRVAAWTR